MTRCPGHHSPSLRLPLSLRADIGHPASAGEPPKQLKGFTKLNIATGGNAAASFKVAAADLTIWDVPSQAWVLVAGSYNVYVGSSSADIRLTGTLTVTA